MVVARIPPRVGAAGIMAEACGCRGGENSAFRAGRCRYVGVRSDGCRSDTWRRPGWRRRCLVAVQTCFSVSQVAVGAVQVLFGDKILTPWSGSCRRKAPAPRADGNPSFSHLTLDAFQPLGSRAHTVCLPCNCVLEASQLCGGRANLFIECRNRISRSVLSSTCLSHCDLRGCHGSKYLWLRVVAVARHVGSGSSSSSPSLPRPARSAFKAKSPVPVARRVA